MIAEYPLQDIYLILLMGNSSTCLAPHKSQAVKSFSFIT